MKAMKYGLIGLFMLVISFSLVHASMVSLSDHTVFVDQTVNIDVSAPLGGYTLSVEQGSSRFLYRDPQTTVPFQPGTPGLYVIKLLNPENELQEEHTLEVLSRQTVSVRTNKAHYRIGDDVIVSLEQASEIRKLTITSDNKIFTYEVPLPASLTFTPTETGVFIVQAELGDSTQVTHSFVVGEALSQAQGPIFINKLEYQIGELLHIQLSEDVTYNEEILIESGTQRYRFLGESNSTIEFMPPGLGTYAVRLVDRTTRSVLSTASFTVIPRTEDFEQIRNASEAIAEKPHLLRMHGKALRQAKSVQVVRVKNRDRGTVELAQPTRHIKKIRLRDFRLDQNASLGLEDLTDVRIGKRKIKKAFAADPTAIDFTNGTITVVAEGTALHKCKDWNFSEQRCFGTWEKVQKLIPGQEYNISIYQGDPGFAESIEIINVQSIPVQGGNWTVQFNTNGTANLTISAINNTFWSNVDDTKDLLFLHLKCGNQFVNYSWIDDKVFVEDYSCNETSLETSKVITPGKHHLMFEFGDDVGFASNFALAGGILMLRESGGGQGLDTTAGVNITWDTNERVDVNYSHTLSSDRIDIQADGIYRISYGLALQQTNARAEFMGRVIRNGQEEPVCWSHTYVRDNSGADEGVLTSDCIINMTVGDQLALNVFRSSTSGTATADVTPNRNWFHIQRIEKPNIALIRDAGGGQNINNVDGVILDWDSHDEFGPAYSFANGNNNVTILQDGLYRITYGVGSDMAAGTRFGAVADIIINGEQYPRGRSQSFMRGNTGADEGIITTDTLAFLSAGDEVQLRVGRESNTAVATADTVANRVWFHFERLVNADTNVIMVHEIGGGQSLDTTAGVDIDFDTTNRSDDHFTKVDANTIRVEQAGFYRIAYNIFGNLTSSDTSRAEFTAVIREGGADSDVCWSQGYNRGTPGTGGQVPNHANFASCIVNLTQSQTLEIRSTRTSTAGLPATTEEYGTWWYIQSLDAINEGPEVTNLTHPPNGSVQSGATIDFNFTATDDNNNMTCTLFADFSGTFEANDSVSDVTNNVEATITVAVPDGTHTWNVQCADPFNETDFFTNNFTVIVDTQPPTITQPSWNVSTINQTQTARFNVTVTDVSNVTGANATLSFPNGTEQVFTLTTTNDVLFQFVLTDTSQLGTYTIHNVSAQDEHKQENISQISVSFSVVASPPAAFDLLSPANNTESTNLQPIMIWERSADAHFQNYTLIFDTDSTFGSPDFTFVNLSVTETNNTLSTSLVDNTHYFWQVTAFDQFGTGTNSTSVFTYITDSVAPFVNLTTNNNTIVTGQNVIFSYAPSDANTYSSCTVFTNSSGVFAPTATNFSISNGTTNTINVTLGEGRYIWNIQCNDTAGNTAFGGDNLTLTVDLNPPNVFLMIPPNNTLENTTNNVFFQANTSDDVSAITSCDLIVNDVVEQTETSITQNVPFNYTEFLFNGDYNWSVNCTDAAGITGASAVHNLSVLVVDSDPPLITLHFPINDIIVPGDTITFNYTPEDASNIASCDIYLDGVFNQSCGTAPTVRYPTNVQAESGFIVMTSGITSTTQTLENSYQLNKTFLFRRYTMNSGEPTNEVPQAVTSYVAFTNCSGGSCNQLNANRNSGATSDAGVSYSILQADNIQTWNFSLTWTSGLNSITFDPDPDLPSNFASKCFVSVHRSTRINSGDVNDYAEAEIQTNITASNSVIFGRDAESSGVAAAGTTAGEVVCFRDTTTVEQVFTSMAEGEPVTNNVLINQVNTSRSFAVVNHRQTDDGVGQNAIRVNISSSTNLELFTEEQGATGAGQTPQVTGYVIEFEGDRDGQVRTHDLTITTSDQNITHTITPPVDTSRTLLNCYNSMGAGGGTAHTRDYWANVLLNGTEIQSINNRIRITSQPTEMYCQLIEWPLYTTFSEEPCLVQNTLVNNFTISNIEEGFHNWSVECTDNSSSFNSVFSSTEFFSNDIADPAVALHDPADNANSSISSVFFNYTPTDGNLDSCILFGNFSGTFEGFNVDSSPNNGIPNNFTRILNDGTFIWNVFCNDTASRGSFATTNFTLHVDTSPPTPLNNITNPSGASYVSGQVYEFNITWVDNFQVQNVTLEHNFTGSLINVSVPFFTNDVFSFTTNDLAAGLYRFRWFANDSLGNLNQSLQQEYTVSKQSSVVNLTINGTDGNVTMDEDLSANFTAVLNNPAVGPIQIFLNGTLVIAGTSPISNVTLFPEPGTWNVTALYPETQNFSESFDTHFLHLNDITAPIVSLQLPAENATSASAGITFQYNVSDFLHVANCSLFINGTLNATNTTVARNTSLTFSTTFQNGGYTWQVNCTDIENNVGASEVRNITILVNDQLFVTVAANQTSYELAEPALINTNVVDIFTTPIADANVTMDVVKGPTDLSWWDTSWQYRRPIHLDEDTGADRRDTSVTVNLTEMNDTISDCSDEIRIIGNISQNHTLMDSIILAGDDSTFCTVQFNANVSGGQINQTSYHAYYGNPSATDPGLIFEEKGLRVFTNTISTTGTTITDTIPSEVDPSKSFIMHTLNVADSSPDANQATANISSGTEVRFTRTLGTGTATVTWQVIESPDISVQRGSLSFGTTEAAFNVSINSVNMNNTFIVVSGQSSSGTDSQNNHGFFRGFFINDTVVQIERQTTGTTAAAIYEVVTWRGSNVQNGTLSFTAASTTAAIETIDTSKSFLYFTRAINGDTGLDANHVRGDIDNANQISFTRVTGQGTAFISWFAVEVPDITVIRKNTTTLTGADGNVGIDPVNQNISFHVTSHTSSGGGTNYQNAMVRKQLTSSTNLLLDKQSSSNTNIVTSFVVQHNRTFTNVSTGSEQVHKDRQEGPTNAAGDTFFTFNTTNQTLGTYSAVSVVVAEDFQAGADADRFTIVLDQTPPVLEIAELNDSLINQSETVRLNATVNDLNFLASVNFTILFPNGTSQNFTMNHASGKLFIYDINTTTQTGTYSVTHIISTDEFGNTNTTELTTLEFNVSLSPPEPFDLLSPPNQTESANLLPNLSWEQSADQNFENYTILLDQDPGFNSPDFAYRNAPVTNTSRVVNFALDANVIYYWRVVAYDIFGASRNSTNDFIYITDTIPPNITLNNPPNNSQITTLVATFNYTPIDINTLDSCTLFSNLSGTFQAEVSSSNITKGVPNILFANVSSGSFVWDVFCNDTSGNGRFADNNFTFHVDVTGPIVNLMVPPNNILENTTNNVFFEANATDELANLSTCELIVNNEIKSTNPGLNNSEPFNFTIFLENGNYNWSVNCSDNFGNVGSSGEYNLSVDVIDVDPPLITLNFPVGISLANPNITFNYTPEDATGLLNCSIYLDGELNQTCYARPTYETEPQAENGFIHMTGTTQTTTLSRPYNISKTFFFRRYATYVTDVELLEDDATAFVTWENCTGEICNQLTARRQASASDIIVSYSLLQANNIRTWNFTHTWITGSTQIDFNPDPDLPSNFAQKCFVNVHRTSGVTTATDQNFAEVEIRTDIQAVNDVEFRRDGEAGSTAAGTSTGEIVCFLDQTNVQEVHRTFTEGNDVTENVGINTVSVERTWAIHNHRQADDGVGQNSIINNITSSTNLELFVAEDGLTTGQTPLVTAYVIDFDANSSAFVEHLRIEPDVTDLNFTGNFNHEFELNRTLLSCDNTMAAGGGTAHTRDYWAFALVNETEVEAINFKSRAVGQISLVNCWGIEWPLIAVAEPVPSETCILRRNVVNNFTIENIDEGVHTWNVECTDNATGLNVGNSSLETFTLDFSDPNVTLHTPVNGSEVNTPQILFNYTPIDVSLDSCQLFSNFSGPFGLTATDSNPTSGIPNNFTRTVNDGFYVWNVFCNDTALRSSFAPENFTLRVDATPPNFSTNVSFPISPTPYISNQLYQFNISWTDNYIMQNVTIEHNFTGNSTNVSVSVSEDGNIVYNFTISDLAVGFYTYRWYANDSLGNQNETPQYHYTVERATSEVNLLLNGTDGNISVNESSTVNSTITMITPDSGFVELYFEGELIQNGTTPLENISHFPNPGIFNITAVYPQTQNFSRSTETHFLTVLDITPPLVTLIFPNQSAFVGSSDISFKYNVTDVSSIDNCSIFIDGALNDTAFFPGRNETLTFNFTLVDGNYTWRVDCFDNASNVGQSETRNFTLIDTTVIVANVVTAEPQYEQGQLAQIITTTTDIFSAPLLSNVTTDVIEGFTNTSWFNTSWEFRQPILTSNPFNITRVDTVIGNVTFANGSIANCANETRIVEHIGDVHTVTPVEIIGGNDETFCEFQFVANVSALAVNESRYHVYYGNPTATDPGANLGVGGIKVQRNTVTSTSTSITDTIESVDTSKAFIIASQRLTDTETDPDRQQITPDFTSPTQVRFLRYTGTSEANVSWQVIEHPDIDVQRNTATLSSTTLNTTVEINPVRVNESFIIIHGRAQTSDQNNARFGYFTGRFLNSTHLFLERRSSGTEAIVSWQVVQWDGSSVQHNNASFSGTTQNVPISQVNTSRSFIVLGSAIDTDPGLDDTHVRGEFASPTQIDFVRNAAGAGSAHVAWFVVELPDDHFIQSGTAAFSVDAQDTTTTPVIVNNTFHVHSFSTSGGGSNYANTRFTVQLLDTTTLEFDKQTASQTQTTPWFVVEQFKGANVSGFGDQQQFITRNSSETDVSGQFVFFYDTLFENFGNYSVVSIATRTAFTDGKDTTTFEIIPDQTAPNITLVSPPDLFQQGVGEVNFTFFVSDLNLDNCTLYFGAGGTFEPNETLTSPVNEANNTFSPLNLGIGLYTWNVNCTDTLGNNGFALQNFTLNITGPDLSIISTDIFSDENDSLIEGENVTIFANVTNQGLTDFIGNFTVQFFEGDPDENGTQINGNSTIFNLSIAEGKLVNVSYVFGPGLNEIFVLVDNASQVNESDESNNKAGTNFSVSLYQTYYGNVSAGVVLANNASDNIATFGSTDVGAGHVFFADADSVFIFSDLQALTRNANNLSVINDFTDADTNLNTTPFNDSIRNVWGAGTDTPIATEQFNLSTAAITNVPIVNSTNSTEFVTGILWDTADDASVNLQYDTTDSEDLVFVTRINPNQQGFFGVYDYEAKVPALLRSYEPSTDSITIYIELT